MAWVFAVPIVVFVFFLVVGSITGQVKMKSCCGIADPHLRRTHAFPAVRQPASPS